MDNIPDIPQIRPKYGVQEVDKQSSVLIPKISLKSVPDGETEYKKPKGGKKERWLRKKLVKIISLILIVFLSVNLILGLLIYNIYKKALPVKASFVSLKSAVEAQDLQLIKKELETTKSAVGDLQKAYKNISCLKVLPLVGSYLKDGSHAINAVGYGIDTADVVVNIIEPYADIIGFSGSNADNALSGEETAQDRLDFIISTIPELTKRADELIEKTSLVKEEIDQIEYEKYPDNIGKYKIKENIKKSIEMFNLGAKIVDNSKPLLEASPFLLGLDEEKTLLVIFQNDKELRPTGGFITAYSIAKVNKGRFEPVVSSDIYNLDNNYAPVTKAPEPIVKYLKGPYLISKNLRLRDMNWSPDFSKSMALFAEEIKSAGIKNIDGIIAVDTQLLVNILEVLGPIGVPGYGDFSTKIVADCNCPQVIYELESFADIEGPIVWSENEPGKIVFAPPNYDNRKKIIGPLMNSVLSNALGQSKEKVAPLFEAVFSSLLEKHVLFYMLDEKAQAGVDSFGIAGTIKEFPGDYLHINDANLGGRKSNLYVTQEVVQDVEIGKDSSITKKITITYKNPEKQDGWLNSVLPNYVRIYVPKGSELIDFSGVEDKVDPYEELDKTVFAGFFELRPQGVAKVEVQYKLPFKTNSEYKLLIQKQPGTDSPLYTINMGKKTDEFFLKTDKELKFAL